MSAENEALRLLSAAWDFGRRVISDAIADGMTASRSKLEGVRAIVECVAEEVQILVGVGLNDKVDGGCEDLVNMAGLLSDVDDYLADGEPDQAMLLLKMYDMPGVSQWRV